MLPKRKPAPVTPDDTARRSCTRYRRWLAVGGILVLALVVFHRPLLVGLGWLLVRDEPEIDFNTVLMLGGDRCYDEAALLLREDASRRVLLIPGAPDNLEKCGAMPAGEITARRLLEERGVPRGAILAADGHARNAWQCARLLQRWMAGHPGSRVLALCGRFDSARIRWVLDQELDSPTVARVSLRGLPDRVYDESNWWRTRRGAKELLSHGLTLLYARIQGEGHVPDQDWDPNEYEDQLRKALDRESP